MAWIKNIFRKPTPLELAARELAELEHSHLRATADREWAFHRINYAEQRMAYLKEFIGEVK